MIYFVQMRRGGPIKIGYTGFDVSSRIKSLDGASPYPLKKLLVIDGSRQEERKLHSRFAIYRIRKEWFRPAAEILEFIRTATPISEEKECRGRMAIMNVRMPKVLAEMVVKKAFENGRTPSE